MQDSRLSRLGRLPDARRRLLDEIETLSIGELSEGDETLHDVEGDARPFRSFTYPVRRVQCVGSAWGALFGKTFCRFRGAEEWPEIPTPANG